MFLMKHMLKNIPCDIPQQNTTFHNKIRNGQHNKLLIINCHPSKTGIKPSISQQNTTFHDITIVLTILYLFNFNPLSIISVKFVYYII